MSTGSKVLAVFSGIGGNYYHNFVSQDIDDFIAKCADAGINRLVPSFSAGIKPSAGVDAHKTWKRPYQPWDFGECSPLVAFTQLAHARGIRVMPYVATGVEGVHWGIDHSNVGEVYPTTVNYHSALLQEHPEYWTRTRDGHCWLDFSYRSPLGKIGYAGFAYPEVRAAERERIIDQVEAGGGDGVQLEFIASPHPAYDKEKERSHTIDFCLDERGNWAYGYDTPALDAFKEQYGGDPRDLDSEDERWVRLRCGYLTQHLREIRQALRGRDIELSVQGVSGTFGSPEGGRQVNVDWGTWVAEGLIDAVYPRYPAHYPKLKLAYDDETVRRMREEVGALRKLLAGQARLIAGLLLPSYSFLTKEVVTIAEAGRLLRRGVDAALDGGAEGIAIYRADRIEALGLWPTLTEIARAYF